MSRRFSLVASLAELRDSERALLTGPYLLGLLDDLHQAPTLGGRQRPGLHQGDPVADACLVVLVVHLDLAGAGKNLGVTPVLCALCPAQPTPRGRVGRSGRLQSPKRSSRSALGCSCRTFTLGRGGNGQA